MRGFAVVGIIAAIAHYIVLRLLQSSGLIPSLALMNMIGFGTGTLVSYLGNRFFVFDAKHSHVRGFLYMLAGYVAAMLTHTGLMVSLTNGSLYSFLDGPARVAGGGFLVWVWQAMINLTPPSLHHFLYEGNAANFSTVSAFLASTSVSASMTFLWNRLVVFDQKPVTA